MGGAGDTSHQCLLSVDVPARAPVPAPVAVPGNVPAVPKVGRLKRASVFVATVERSSEPVVSASQQRVLEIQGLASVSSAISRMEEIRRKKEEQERLDPAKFRSGKAWKPAVYGTHGDLLDTGKAAQYVSLLLSDLPTYVIAA